MTQVKMHQLGRETSSGQLSQYWSNSRCLNTNLTTAQFQSDQSIQKSIPTNIRQSKSVPYWSHCCSTSRYAPIQIWEMSGEKYEKINLPIIRKKRTAENLEISNWMMLAKTSFLCPKVEKNDPQIYSAIGTHSYMNSYAYFKSPGG